MEVVPTAEFLEGQKERFDLGVFVGDLALHEEVASDDESLEGCGRSSTTARTIRKSQTSWPMASNCESTQKC